MPAVAEARHDDRDAALRRRLAREAQRLGRRLRAGAAPGAGGRAADQAVVQRLVLAAHRLDPERREHPRARALAHRCAALRVRRAAPAARRRTPRRRRAGSISTPPSAVHHLGVARERGRDDRDAHRQRLVDDVRHALVGARHQRHVRRRQPARDLLRRRMEAHDVAQLELVGAPRAPPRAASRHRPCAARMRRPGRAAAPPPRASAAGPSAPRAGPATGSPEPM